MSKVCTVFLLILLITTSGCTDEAKSNKLIFGTSADYPPFEYMQKGEIMGFDIDLAKLIAQEMGKEATFSNMQFSSILSSLQDGSVDIGISNFTITAERQKNFDFSDPYYNESLAIMFNKKTPLTNKSQLVGKKIACQLGTTMEIWLKKNALQSEIITMDNNSLAIEALKVGHVDGVLIDHVQSVAFSKKNETLSHTIIDQSDTGYGIVFKKGSPLTAQVNKILKSLESKGEIDKLKQKWLEEKK